MQVGVVPGVVACHNFAKPVVVVLVGGLPGLALAQRRVRVAISTSRRRMKSSWIGIGFSHHSVPSLSKTATRSSTGTGVTHPGRLPARRSRRSPVVRRRRASWAGCSRSRYANGTSSGGCGRPVQPAWRPSPGCPRHNDARCVSSDRQPCTPGNSGGGGPSAVEPTTRGLEVSRVAVRRVVLGHPAWLPRVVPPSTGSTPWDRV